MRKQRGWCLLEVLVVVFTGAAVAGTAAVLVEKQAQTSRTMDAYGQGLRELRAVLDDVADDVRAGRDVTQLWRLDRDKLYQGKRVRATRVAAFETRTENGVTTIRIAPMSRVLGATSEPTTSLSLRVAKREGA